MSITTVTQFHAAPGQADALTELLVEGSNRMRAAEGCESFELLRDENDTNAFAFVQHWASHPAHDAAFGEQILMSGHLDKVIATLDEPIAQHSYQAV